MRTLSIEKILLSRMAELLNHKEKQRGCRLLDANKSVLMIVYVASLLKRILSTQSDIDPHEKWRIKYL